MENEYQNSYEQPVAENVEFAAPAPEKKGVNKIVALLVAVVAIIGVILLIGAFTNTYKTPLKLEMAYENAKTLAKQDKAYIAQVNGLCQNDVKQIMNILKKSEDYDKDDEKEAFDEYLEDMEDQWGKNWKYSFKIEDKDEAKKDDIKDVKAEIKAAAKAAEEALEDVGSGDYDDIADELGITKAQAKKLVKHLKNIAKKLRNVKVTKGYELEVTESIKGSDDDDDYDYTTYVYKVNGKWIGEGGIQVLSGMLYYARMIQGITD